MKIVIATFRGSEKYTENMKRGKVYLHDSDEVSLINYTLCNLLSCHKEKRSRQSL
jgi:hypothetical protein